jgi:hypothetical protein
MNSCCKQYLSYIAWSCIKSTYGFRISPNFNQKHFLDRILNTCQGSLGRSLTTICDMHQQFHVLILHVTIYDLVQAAQNVFHVLSGVNLHPVNPQDTLVC